MKELMKEKDDEKVMNIKFEGNIRDIVQKLGLKRILMLLMAGILLIIVAVPKNKNDEIETLENKNNNTNVSDKDYAKEQERKLENILTSVYGENNIKVMITLKSSKEEVILKDSPYSKEEKGEENVYANEEETVIVEDTEGNSYPYVVKEINPEIEGIVVAVKSNEETIEKEINEVVLALFDIPVHKIKVMKIK